MVTFDDSLDDSAVPKKSSLFVYLLKPWLFLPSSITYKLSPHLLKIYSLLFSSPTYEWRSFSWKGMRFPNPLGIAGGVDKNATGIKHWKNLSVGFCEIGTITPLAQKPNPSKILDRSLRYQSLWNSMGFPNQGLSFAIKQLANLPATKNKIPLLINIGKNRDTATQKAVEDYKKCMTELYSFADIFVINISSPNTKNLRSLFDENFLSSFLKELNETSQSLFKNTGKKVPLILKLSPDESQEGFLRIIDQSLEAGIDGWCISNTTTKRQVAGLFPAHGGISGRLLKQRSLKLLKILNEHLKEKNVTDKLIISCGGIFDEKDVLDRLNHGAHLIQVYSALVFKGPGFFQSVLKKLQSGQS